MTAPSDPLYTASPVWLDVSGLPDALHAVRKNAWTVFKKVVELDCAAHPAMPGIVEASGTQIGQRCGFEGAAVVKCIDGFRKKKLVRAFIPDHHDEAMLIEIVCPLVTPIAGEELQRAMELALGVNAARAPRRYATAPGLTPDPQREDLLKAVVDRYLHRMSLTMNAFVMDELAILASRYNVSMIEAAMKSAAAAGEKSLGGVFRRLAMPTKDDR